MAIHGFAFGKVAKPGHEHHLQACQKDPQACFSYSMTNLFTFGYCSQQSRYSKLPHRQAGLLNHDNKFFNGPAGTNFWL
jgi:hypothetical protein